MRLAVLLLFVPACIDATPAINVFRSSLQGGAEQSGYPAVGVLASGSGRCTATLIGKRSVLTAAHCIKTTTLTFTICPNSVTCSSSTGTNYSGTATKFPGWTGTNTNDLALVALQRDVSEATPIAINTAPVTVGQAIAVVGYGQPGFGTKRSGENTISIVSATSFRFANLPNVDNGDSGGPTFVTVDGELLVAGVHSTKGTGGGTDIRVDAFESWILDVTSGDVALPKVGLPSGGNPAAGPSTEGESCYNRACASGLVCVTIYDSNYSTERGRYCMEVCQSPGAMDPICDGPEACIDSKSAGPVCFAKDNDAQGFTNQDGSSDSPGPAATSPATLAPELADPPSPEAPSETSPGGQILPDPQSPIDRGFGAVCKSSADCLSGLCAEQQGYGQFCTAACNPTASACPGEAECFPTADGAGHVCSAPVVGEGAHQLADAEALYGACRVADDAHLPDLTVVLLLALLLCHRRKTSNDLEADRLDGRTETFLFDK